MITGYEEHLLAGRRQYTSMFIKLSAEHYLLTAAADCQCGQGQDDQKNEPMYSVQSNGCGTFCFDENSTFGCTLFGYGL